MGVRPPFDKEQHPPLAQRADAVESEDGGRLRPSWVMPKAQTRGTHQQTAQAAGYGHREERDGDAKGHCQRVNFGDGAKGDAASRSRLLYQRERSALG